MLKVGTNNLGELNQVKKQSGSNSEGTGEDYFETISCRHIEQGTTKQTALLQERILRLEGIACSRGISSAMHSQDRQASQQDVLVHVYAKECMKQSSCSIKCWQSLIRCQERTQRSIRGAKRMICKAALKQSVFPPLEKGGKKRVPGETMQHYTSGV